MIKPLTLVINQTLVTGIFPEKLKIAKVSPFFKNILYYYYGWLSPGVLINGHV